MAASNWFAIIMIPAAVMTGCSSPATDENAQTSTKRAVPPVSSSQAMIKNVAWMNLTNGQIQALADQALSCDGNVHRIVKCPPGPRKARAAWVDFDRNHPLSFDSINLSFEVSKQGLAAEPLARIPPEPIRLVRFFFPDWRGGAAWLRYAVKHSQGQCPMQARLADADLSVIGQYRYDPRNETEGFIAELRIYRRSAHAERLLDQCVREEVTDSSEIRSHALVNGMSVEEALKLERTDQGS